MRDYNHRQPPVSMERVRLPGQRKVGDEKSKGMSFLQAMLILVGLLAVVLIAVKGGAFLDKRQFTDARKKADAALELINVEDAGTVSDYTVFVVRQGGKYYLFWKNATAAGFGLVAYNDDDVVSFPLMYKDSEVYPFDVHPFIGTEEMVNPGGSKVMVMQTAAGFLVADDSYFVRFEIPAEWGIQSFPEGVDVYSIWTGANDLKPVAAEENLTKGVTEEQKTGATPKPDTGTPVPNGTPNMGS